MRIPEARVWNVKLAKFPEKIAYIYMESDAEKKKHMPDLHENCELPNWAMKFYLLLNRI